MLGTGGLLGLLVVSMLAVGYLLPAPMLVVPAAAATAVAVHITARSRDVRAVAATPRRLTDTARAAHVDAAPRRRRTTPAWPTGRHRRASLRAAAHVGGEITASPWRTSGV